MGTLKVLGCGGAGSRFLRYIRRSTPVEGYSINDKNSDIIVDPQKVIAYADVSSPLIMRAFSWVSHITEPYIFVLAGLGGDLGTSLAHLIGNAKRSKATLIGIFTLPFSSENMERRAYAIKALEKIEKLYHIYFVLDNDGLVRHYSHVPINVAMQIPPEVMKHIIIDFQRVLLKNMLNVKLQGRVGVGVGLGSGKNKLQVAIEDALDSPWLSEGKKIMLFSGELELEDAEIASKPYNPEFVDVYFTHEYGDQVKVTILTRE